MRKYSVTLSAPSPGPSSGNSSSVDLSQGTFLGHPDLGPPGMIP